MRIAIVVHLDMSHIYPFYSLLVIKLHTKQELIYDKDHIEILMNPFALYQRTQTKHANKNS